MATGDSTTSTTGHRSPDLAGWRRVGASDRAGDGSCDVARARDGSRRRWPQNPVPRPPAKNWTRTGRDRDGRNRDRSVQGAYLAVNGSGSTRSWSFVGRAPQPTDEARNWLDEHFGSRGLSDEQWLRMMLPDERVAVGIPGARIRAVRAGGGGQRHEGRPVQRQGNRHAAGHRRWIGPMPFPGYVGVAQVPARPGMVEGRHDDLRGRHGRFPGALAPLRLATLHRKAALQGETTEDGTTMSTTSSP